MQTLFPLAFERAFPILSTHPDLQRTSLAGAGDKWLSAVAAGVPHPDKVRKGAANRSLRPKKTTTLVPEGRIHLKLEASYTRLELSTGVKAFVSKEFGYAGEDAYVAVAEGPVQVLE